MVEEIKTEGWTFDKTVDAWLLGEPLNGCGVFKQYTSSLEQRWMGNVSYGGQVVNIGPCNTKEEAMSETEALFKKMKGG